MRPNAGTQELWSAVASGEVGTVSLFHAAQRVCLTDRVSPVSQHQPPRRPLWPAAADGAAPPLPPTKPSQAAASLAKLVEARQTPTQQQAALLLDTVQRPGAPPAHLLPALALLARWARQQALQPAAGRDAQLLQRASAAGQALLDHLGTAPAPEQPLIAASCLLLLSSAAAAATQPGSEDEAVEAVGSALLDGRLGVPVPSTAADAMAAVGTLLPCVEVSACGGSLRPGA